MSDVIWRRPGWQIPTTWFGEILSLRPDEARELLTSTLRKNGGACIPTAKELGISRSWLRLIMKRFGLLSKQFQDEQRARFRLAPLDGENTCDTE